MTSDQRLGRHRPEVTSPGRPGRVRPRQVRRVRRRTRIVIAVVLVAALAGVAGLYATAGPATGAGSLARGDARDPLPTRAGSYLGLYPDGVPSSYANARAFTSATGVTPNLVVYYSGWLEPFQARFASTASRAGSVPLVQINPTGVSLAAIAAGQYDEYLRGYAAAVHRYGHPLILSFGHEMNGTWYSWAAGHTAPATFVRAWRHIVDVFRAAGTWNVTWLWTVNVVQARTASAGAGTGGAEGGVASPRPWWPGAQYVSWVGIDGYYYSPATSFAALFGPAVAGVRAWTRKPILIAETSATPSAGQPAKIADLFAGIHLYGLLGFVWFDNKTNQDWRLTSATAIAAFKRAARGYHLAP
ncbi:MAG TPA: glycosyl hydrolase [Streptosporangiaceae bacterium]